MQKAKAKSKGNVEKAKTNAKGKCNGRVKGYGNCKGRGKYKRQKVIRGKEVPIK